MDEYTPNIDTARGRKVLFMGAANRVEGDEGRVLPAMPDGWAFDSLQQLRDDSWYFVMKMRGRHRVIAGSGETPRDAMLAAFAYAKDIQRRLE